MKADENKPLSMPATFEHLRGAFEHLSSEHETELDITKDFLDALTAEVEEIKAEIRRLEESLPALKKRMDGIWEGEREFEYELVSVFMHRGEWCSLVGSQDCLLLPPSDHPHYFGRRRGQ